MIELNRNVLQKSVREMEENSYRNLCLMEKSVVNPFAFVYINEVDSERIFKAAFNKNAKYIYFTRNDIKYIKFEVSINLNNKMDEIDRKKSIRSNTKYEINKKNEGKKSYGEFITLNERGKMNRNTMEVYVNGLKVPDKNILVTLFSGSTDLYIPVKYLGNWLEDKVEITLVVNKFSNINKYYNSYSDKITSNYVKIPFLDNEKMNKENLRVYINGFLTTSYLYDDYTKAIDLTQLAIKEGDEVEFIYRVNTQNKFDGLPSNKIITFDKNLLKNKPIFSDIFECYINGVRQFPKDMKNVSPRNIALNNFTNGDNIVYYLCYDKDFPSEKNRYIDDLTRFFNYRHEDASIILNGEYEGYLPEYIKNINFPPEVIKVMNEDRNKTSETLKEFLELKSKEYIKQNAENFKYLLNDLKSVNTDHYFSAEYIESHIRRDTSNELGEIEYRQFSKDMVVFQFPKIDDEVKDLFILFVDNERVDNSNMISIYYRNTVYLYIEREFFKEDCETLRFLQFPIYNLNHEDIKVTSSEMHITKGKDLGIIRDISDLFVMERSGNGYKADLNFTREETDKEIIIKILDYDDTKEYIIYNASFTMKNQYIIKSTDIKGNEPVKIPFDIFKDKYIPMTTFYTPLIFKNNKLLSKGIDYQILTQFNNPNREYAEIVFGMKCKEGDIIDFIYTEYVYESLGGVDYINSDYGVIYFEDLIVPFDTGYLDLYVDGKIVNPDDIEIISTNMIKVYNVENLINVGIRSKLNIPLHVIRDYTDTFIDNPSLWDEYIKRYWWNYKKEDEFYLEMNPDAEKIKHELPEEENRFDIMIDFIGRCLIQGILPRLIDCNLYYDFSKCYHVREYLLDNHDYIELDCNREQLSESCDIDMERYMKSYEEIVDAVSRACTDDILDATEAVDESNPLWLEIYEDELAQAQLN